jgi:tripartite-type tricarboxylate transporter receptor subunit TctC
MNESGIGFGGRRSFLKLIPGAGLAATFPAWAQDAYPTRQISVIAPFTAGGMTDVVLRRSCEAAAKQLGQPVVVENRVGAAGAIGVAAVAKARNDGYTLGQFLGNLPLQYHTTEVPFHPLRDFSFIVGLAATGMGLAVRGDSKYRTAQEFIAAAKAAPDSTTVAHSGVATGGHVVAVGFERLGVKLRQIPFKGAEWIAALQGGHVDAILGTISYPGQLESGAFRLLATFGDARMPRYADVPTARELGYAITVLTPLGLMGPAGLPARVVRNLHDAFRSWTEAPDYQKTLDQFQLLPWYRSSADLEAWVRQQYSEDLAFAERLGIAVKR